MCLVPILSLGWQAFVSATEWSALPSDASSLMSVVLRFAEAVAHWPLWLTALLAGTFTCLYCLFLFGSNRIWKALTIISSKELRAARIAQTLSDEPITIARENLVSRALIRSFDWTPIPPLPRPSFFPLRTGMSDTETKLWRSRAYADISYSITGYNAKLYTKIEDLQRVNLPGIQIQEEIEEYAKHWREDYLTKQLDLEMCIDDESVRTNWHNLRLKIDMFNKLLCKTKDTLQSKIDKGYRLRLPDSLLPSMVNDILERH